MRKHLGVLAVAGLISLPGLASAAGPMLSDIFTNSGITETGHLSASYDYGFNKGQTLAYRAFDGDSDTFEFNQAMLTLAKQPSDGFGGLVTLLAGSDAKGVNAAYGNGSNADFALMQAYVQYAHDHFTIIGGRYVTLAGNEVIDDSADTNISRSLLFELAEPLVHTGVRASYALGSTTFYLGINNGIYTGNALDTNKQKTLETGVSVVPTSNSSLGVYDYYSHEGGAGLKYADFVGSVQITKKLQVVLNGDWFTEHSPSFGEGNIYGLAAYLNYVFNDRWKGSLRGEYLKARDDGALVALDNANPGDKKTLGEITGTVGYSPITNLTLLGELRYDMGSKVYPNPGLTGSDYSDTQGNIAVKAIYTF